MYVWFLVCTLLSILAETKCDSTDTVVNITLSNTTTACVSGVIEGQDNIIFHAAIDTTNVNLRARHKIYFESKPISNVNYNNLCFLNISQPCVIKETERCYCKAVTGSIIEVVFNMTAHTSISEQHFRIHWPIDGDFPDVSSNQVIPKVYSKVKENLTFNGLTLSLTDGSINEHSENASLRWCVTNLLNHTLFLVYNGESHHSTSDCVEHTTIKSKVSCQTKMVNLTVSYEETSGCQRKGGPYTSTFNVRPPPCPLYCIAFIVIHGACTFFEIIIIGIIICLLSSHQNAHSCCRSLYLGLPPLRPLLKDSLVLQLTIEKFILQNTTCCVYVLLCITLAALELVRFALAIVYCILDECKCCTTVPLCEIMLIYQFGTNGIFLVVDVVYLFIKIGCNTSELFDKPWITVVVCICIHSVVGMIALPIVFICLCKCHSSKNSGDVSDNENGHHLATRIENDNASHFAPKPPKAISSHSNAIDPEIESNTEASAAPSNGEERSKRKKKKRSKPSKNPQNDNGEIDATSSTSGVEVNLKESEDNAGKINQTNQGVIFFKKRPPSVEITNNPNQITPRPLPQSKGAGELPPIKNK